MGFPAKLLVESGAILTIIIRPLGTTLTLVSPTLRPDNVLICSLPDDTNSLLAAYPIISASKQVRDTLLTVALCLLLYTVVQTCSYE